MAPSTWTGPGTHTRDGCSACCPSSLRQSIPARSIHVCRIYLVSRRGMLPGNGMERPWGWFLISPTTPLVAPK